MWRRPLNMSRTSVFLPVQKPDAHWISWNKCWCCMTNSTSHQRCNGVPSDQNISKRQVAARPKRFFAPVSKQVIGLKRQLQWKFAANHAVNGKADLPRCSSCCSSRCAENKRPLRKWSPMPQRCNWFKRTKNLGKNFGLWWIWVWTSTIITIPFSEPFSLSFVGRSIFERYSTLVFGLLSPGTFR